MVRLFVNYKLYLRRKVHLKLFTFDDKYGCDGKNLSTAKIWAFQRLK